jgi:hypothetical protein
MCGNRSSDMLTSLIHYSALLPALPQAVSQYDYKHTGHKLVCKLPELLCYALTESALTALYTTTNYMHLAAIYIYILYIGSYITSGIQYRIVCTTKMPSARAALAAALCCCTGWSL